MKLSKIFYITLYCLYVQAAQESELLLNNAPIPITIVWGIHYQPSKPSFKSMKSCYSYFISACESSFYDSIADASCEIYNSRNMICGNIINRYYNSCAFPEVFDDLRLAKMAWTAIFKIDSLTHDQLDYVKEKLAYSFTKETSQKAFLEVLNTSEISIIVEK